MGMGFKVNVIYGGCFIVKDFEDFQYFLVLFIGILGWIVDYLKWGIFLMWQFKFFILDEFDKLLEIGFVDEMEVILEKIIFVE